MGLAPPEALARGVWTASAGNMAQGVAWEARRRGIPCTVVVPGHRPGDEARGDHAAVGAHRRRCRSSAGGRSSWITTIPAWKGSSSTRRPTRPSSRATERSVSRSSKTSRISTPCSCPGAAAASPAASRRRLRGAGSAAKVFACEVETAAPFAASLAAGRPTTIDYTRELRRRHRRPERPPRAVAAGDGAPRRIPRRLARGDGGGHPPSRAPRARRGGGRRRRARRRRALS